MRNLFRIKPRTAPYRRAGLVFETAAEFVDYDPNASTPEQVARHLADERLVIQVCSDPDAEPDARIWEDIPEHERELARDQLTVLEAADWAELKGDGTGEPLDPIAVELVDTLTLAIEEHAPDLQRLGVTFAANGEVLPGLIRQLDGVVVERDAISQALTDIKAEKTALSEELDLVAKGRATALADIEGLRAEVETLKAAATAKDAKKPGASKPA